MMYSNKENRVLTLRFPVVLSEHIVKFLNGFLLNCVRIVDIYVFVVALCENSFNFHILLHFYVVII